MKEAVVFKGTRREATGKGVARKLRNRGYLPGVVYGPDLPATPFSLEAKDSTMRTFKGAWSEAKLYDLLLEDKTLKVIIKDVQIDPVNLDVLHVDFYAVTFGKSMTLMIPLKFQGEPIGVKKGGVIEYLVDEIEVECLPKNIPEELYIDTSALDIGDTLFIRDVSLPEGVTLKSDPSQPVATVMTTAAEKAEETEEPEEEELKGEEED